MTPTVQVAQNTPTDTLPYSWYTDPDVFHEESRKIFSSSWQYVGTKDQLAEPGAFLTAWAGSVPVLVVRDESGNLGAFVNVCRHRGSVLVPVSSGVRKAIQCGYHAWTYRLDGTLFAAPASKDEQDFDPADFSLRKIGLDSLGPFLFVNPNPKNTLLDILGELPTLVQQTGLNLAGLRFRMRREFEIKANWKTVVDNYLECYHCPVAHPGFCDVLDVKDYTVEEYGYFSTQRTPARNPNAHVGEGVADGFFAFLWPNFSINIYPGPGNVSVNLFRPVAVDRTIAVFDYCFTDEVSRDEVEAFAAFVEQVQVEDTALCEAVQVGLGSGMLERGRLLLSKESALRHFQALVAQALED